MWYNKYIDIPYKDGGRDLEGLDCWGLVRLVYKEQYGIELPSFSDSYTTAKDTDHLHELISRHREQWDKLSSPVEGCVVLLRIFGTDTHVGVYLGNDMFLHVREGTNVAVENINSPTWKTRVVGYFNYKEDFKEIVNVIAAPNPLKTQIVSLPVAEGTKLIEIADYIKTEYGISDKLYSRIIFLLNGKIIDKEDWDSTRISKSDTLEYRAVPAGGSIGRLIMFVAVMYIAIQTGMYVGGTESTIFGTGMGMGTGYGIAAQAAVMVAGSALINAIAPIRPPDMPGDPGATQAQQLINGAQNQAMPYGAIPVVLGKMRVTPPLGASNFVHFSGDSGIPTDADIRNSGGVAGSDTFVDMLLVWGYGPLSIDTSTLRIGQVNVYNTDGSKNYTNFRDIHLDRISDTTTNNLLSAFNAIYGKDVQQHFPNQPLAYDGLPPAPKRGSYWSNLAWTPQPKPSDSTGWVTYGFSQPSESLSVSINFPQGLRAIKVQGDGAGNNYAAPVGVQIQYKVGTTGAWTNWNNTGYFYVGGTLGNSTGTIDFTEYSCDEYACGYSTYPRPTIDNEILGGGPIKDAFTWTVSLNRQEVSGGVVTLTRWQSSDLIQIRIRRITGDNTEPNSEYRYSHQMAVHTVTSYNNTSPCIDPPNVKIAKSAITIQATDQINGQIDGINALVQTVCKDWDTTTQTWVERATSNPASLYRYVLQHPANPQRVTDAQINLTQLQHWHEYCNQTKTVSYSYNGLQQTITGVKLEYNSVHGGTQRSVLDVLRDICAAGRASPAMVDGKWTVVIDEPKSTIIQHFTPHNSWGFEATKLLPRMPEALKVQFNDRDSDYVQKEIIVAYSNKDVNSAQLLESIQLPGVTSTGEAVDHARWHLAQIKLRPEVYTINTDIEYIVCNRGDRVKVTHDVPMWGSGSGRVKNTYGTSTTNITVLELDEPMLIDVAKAYNIRLRNSSTGSSNVFNINKSFNISSVSRSNNIATVMFANIHPLNVGDSVVISSGISDINATVGAVESIVYNAYGPIGITYTNFGNDLVTTTTTGTGSLVTTYYKSVQLTTATNASTVAAGDLFLFGELNSESQDLIVTKIEPTSNKSARITLVDYGVASNYNIFTDYINVSSNAIFEAQITQPPIELFNQIADAKPIVDVTKIVSDESVLRRLSPGVFEYVIRVPFTNPSNLSNDIGTVVVEVMPANMPDTSGSKTFTADISLNSIDIVGVQESETYRFRLKYLSKSGRVGNWTSWYGHKVVGKTSLPSAVTGFTNSISGTSIKLSWTANSEIDLSTYEIRSSNSGWGTDNNYIFKGDATNCLVPAPAPGTAFTWYIKAVDVSKNYSANSATTTLNAYTVPNISLGTVVTSFNNSSLVSSTITVAWDNVAPLFGLNQYEVSYEGLTKTTKSNQITLPADWLGNRTLLIKTVDQLGQSSTGISVVLGKSAPNAPTIPSQPATITQGVLNLSWNAPAVTSVPIWGYEVSTDSGFGTSGQVFKGATTSCSVPQSKLVLGTNNFYVRTIDTDNRVSSTATITYSLAAPINTASVNGVFSKSSLTEATIELTWSSVDCIFGTAYYQVSYYDDTLVPAATVTKLSNSTSIILPANWLGDRVFTVKVVDNLGNVSSGTSTTITKQKPNAVVNARSQVIDNNVLLYWNFGTKTTLPVSHVLVKRSIQGDGSTWTTAVSLGTKSGEFTSVSELTAAKYIYWIAAIDTDGRESDTVQVSADVSQPPDFKFNAEYSSLFNGTANATTISGSNTVVSLINTTVTNSNTAVYAGELFLPINTSESWTTHFTARSWTTPQDQVNAGYPIYAQPGIQGTAYYEETFDYGTVLGGSQVTATILGTAVSGSVNVTTSISISADNTNWTVYSGMSSVFAKSFRYVKVRIDASTASLGNIYKIYSLKVRLDAKQKTESDSTTCLLSDTNGTIINFVNEFVDVQSITVSPSNTGATIPTGVVIIPVYDFKDAVINGTYSITSNIATLSVTGHGLVAGQKVRIYFTSGSSGTPTSGVYTVASVINANSYTINITNANTSGNVSTYSNSMRIYLYDTSGNRVTATTSYIIRGY